MARYIDADKLIEALRADFDREGSSADEMAIKGLADASVKYNHGQFCYLNAIERVKDTPTADVVPRTEVLEVLAEIESMISFIHDATGLEIVAFGKYAELKKKYIEGEKNEDQSD